MKRNFLTSRQIDQRIRAAREQALVRYVYGIRGSSV
jgi:hypothetical protein